jgi:hypothetical protein
VYSTLLFFLCYSNLLLRRGRLTRILSRGILGYVLPRLPFPWSHEVFHCSVSLWVVIAFRDIIYIIILFYLWHLIICEQYLVTALPTFPPPRRRSWRRPRVNGGGCDWLREYEGSVDISIVKGLWKRRGCKKKKRLNKGRWRECGYLRLDVTVYMGGLCISYAEATLQFSRITGGQLEETAVVASGGYLAFNWQDATPAEQSDVERRGARDTTGHSRPVRHVRSTIQA